MALFDASFSIRGSGAPESLPASGGAAPDMRAEICGRGRNQEGEVPIPIAGVSPRAVMSQDDNSPAAFFFAERNRGQGTAPAQGSTMANFSGVQLGQREQLRPVPIYIGRAPGWNGRVAGPTGVDVEPEAVPEKPGRGKRVAAKPGKRGAAARTASAPPARHARAVPQKKRR